MGHAYSSIVSDFFARFKKIQGFNVFNWNRRTWFKDSRAAEKNKKEPLEFCNEISKTFKDLSKTLNLSNHGFYKNY